MTETQKLFKSELKAINLGLPSFAQDLKSLGVAVVHVDWRPIAGGNVKVINLLDMVRPCNKITVTNLVHRPAIRACKKTTICNGYFLTGSKKVAGRAESFTKGGKVMINVQEANQKVLSLIKAAVPVLEGIAVARDVVPGMHDRLVLHAGPPITWERMSGPMRGAVMGALIHEKLASSVDEAEKLAASNEIEYSPWHEHDGVGPMAGVATASMPVWVVKNTQNDRKTFCTLNEGLGKVLRYGAYSAEVIDRLNWMRDLLAPVLTAAINSRSQINLKSLIAQALQMGDEVHNRNRAATSLLYRELASAVVGTDYTDEQKRSVLDFIHSNDHFFLNLSMPACKAMLQAGEWIEGSTVVTTMARNGTDFGIRISGMKDRWFTAPALMVKGLLFPGFTEDDCNLDIGDSTITETCGLGGFSMAAAPAIVKFVGGTAADAVNFTRKMYEITVGESDFFQIPSLDFRGSPVGIDLLKVCELNILPQINTGIAHKLPGVGQTGAGLVNPPMKCFEDALEAYVNQYCPHA